MPFHVQCTLVTILQFKELTHVNDAVFHNDVWDCVLLSTDLVSTTVLMKSCLLVGHLIMCVYLARSKNINTA